MGLRRILDWGLVLLSRNISLMRYRCLKAEFRTVALVLLLPPILMRCARRMLDRLLAQSNYIFEKVCLSCVLLYAVRAHATYVVTVTEQGALNI